MTDRNIYSGESTEALHRAADDSGNGLKGTRVKSNCLDDLNLLGSGTTVSTTAGGDGAKDDKKVSWETMLPSKRANTIGRLYIIKISLQVSKKLHYDQNKMLEHGEKLDLEGCLLFGMIIPQQMKLKWG